MTQGCNGILHSYIHYKRISAKQKGITPLRELSLINAMNFIYFLFIIDSQ